MFSKHSASLFERRKSFFIFFEITIAKSENMCYYELNLTVSECINLRLQSSKGKEGSKYG